MPIGYDGEEFSQEDAEALRRALGLPDKSSSPLLEENIGAVAPSGAKPHEKDFGLSGLHPHNHDRK